MKRYFVTVQDEQGNETGFTVHARNETSARNKALRRCKGTIKSVEYLGFYLNRVFVPVD